MPHNKAAVVLANKLARTAWRILRHGSQYTVQGDEPLGGAFLERDDGCPL
jgi:hypothetical protein